jgi:hypothetical protein
MVKYFTMVIQTNVKQEMWLVIPGRVISESSNPIMPHSIAVNFSCRFQNSNITIAHSTKKIE